MAINQSPESCRKPENSALFLLDQTCRAVNDGAASIMSKAVRMQELLDLFQSGTQLVTLQLKPAPVDCLVWTEAVLEPNDCRTADRGFDKTLLARQLLGSLVKRHQLISDGMRRWKFIFVEAAAVDRFSDAAQLMSGFPTERQALLHHSHELAFRNARVASG